jgi:hypothetical protein
VRLRLTNEVVVKRHEEKLGDRIPDLISGELAETDYRAQGDA